jgi:hypothetical protein
MDPGRGNDRGLSHSSFNKRLYEIVGEVHAFGVDDVG